MVQEAPSTVLPWLVFSLAVLGLLTTWFWNMYNKAKNDKNAEKLSIDAKIKEIENNLNVFKERLAEVKSDFNSKILEMSIKTLNRDEANLMVEEKLKPLRDMLTQNKDDLKEVKQDQKQILSTLNNVIVALEGYRRRRDDE